MDKSDTFWGGFGVAVALALVTLVGYPLIRAIAADGQVEYCYVHSISYRAPSQADVVTYDLYGFRPWRTDRLVTQNLKSLDEVRDAAIKLGCTIR